MILERIHSVLGDLFCTYRVQQTYVDDYGPWIVVLAAAAFAIISTANILIGYTLGQLIFGRAL